MIVALLAFYDEEPEWLAATIASLARCNVDHLVAVDGAYMLYRGGHARSDAQQARTITETCYGAGIGLTLHQPHQRWIGNEVEKRSFMFRLAEAFTTENDWYWVIDADEVITTPVSDLHAQLAATDLDAAEVTLYEHHNASTPAEHGMPMETQQPLRMLFRAIRGLHVAGNHYTYLTGDNRAVWGQPNAHQETEPALSIPQIRVQHRTRQRRNARSKAQHDYYRLRRETGIETGPCDRCTLPATRIIATNFEPAGFGDNDRGGLTAGHTSVCDQHAEEVDAENRARIIELGFDPDGLKAHMHQPA